MINNYDYIKTLYSVVDKNIYDISLKFIIQY